MLNLLLEQPEPLLAHFAHLWFRQLAVAEPLALILTLHLPLLPLGIFLLHATSNKTVQLVIELHGRVVALQHQIDSLVLLTKRALGSSIKVANFVWAHTRCLVIRGEYLAKLWTFLLVRRHILDSPQLLNILLHVPLLTA